MELLNKLINRAVMESVEAGDDEKVHRMRLIPQKIMTEVTNYLPLAYKME